jgi:site-specific recombinase XerD
MGFDVLALMPSWKRALSSDNKSPETIKSYLDSVRRLAAFLDSEALPLGPDAIRAFLTGERERTSAWSAQKHYRNLSVYFGWCVREGDTGLDENPMDLVGKPKVSEVAKPFFTDRDLSALLKVTRGQDFESRRDHAMIRILVDSGMRISGLAGLRFDPADESLSDVFLDQARLRIRLKGGDGLFVPIGRQSVAALDRYLRSRARRPNAHSPWLWLGTRGRGMDHFGPSGIHAMLGRRGEEASVQDCHAHRFRHTFADSWLGLGGNIDDLMTVAGWRSVAMPLKYAKGRGVARAAEAHRRLSPGDRL